ncbi:PREDICTED: beta-1,3-galactosyl-O-glycosyl-glycoprotein beta-1,6-N-acetylglucosaminyltransferase 4-like [Cyprinodon variegatus]|uniref:Glucosaminyl (N-acetyl) transferase 4b, tandem duplicate 2 n=1 Tax=Cyprinodon variegatus TaxID=28743 RepID=A0A3Q2CYH1_CYPVA|nr:PREDICTED: beta-1,3-galactosyl-O-glycosyl-glycoprotein beta-1,6-N-acetylglucosaminyltransferase 4-like [Cyprinodon variegatus]
MTSRRFLLKLRKTFLTSFLSALALAFLLVSIKYIYIPASPSQDPIIEPFVKHNISCEGIYNMDPVEVGKSLIIRRKTIEEGSDESLIKTTEDCPFFMKHRGYGNMCISEEEKDFPIAYSLVVHKNAWMVEKLLRAVYSPSNIYCIHYDQKSSAQFMAAMEGLARCLPNVFISSKREAVYYASISRLKADLNCLSDLLISEVKWKYVINLCGQDFPLKSNMELVSELKLLKGSNMLETSKPSDLKKERFLYHHELQEASFEYKKLPVKTQQEKTQPPHGIKMFIGNAYFVLSREFVEFTNSSAVVRDFLAWSEDTYSPDEHFWATLVRLPGVPGGLPRSHPDVTDLMSKTRLVKWHYLEENLYPPCSGTHVRSVCIFGAAELYWLLNYGHWFANKFDPKVDPVLIQCLEEKLIEKQKILQKQTTLICPKG